MAKDVTIELTIDEALVLFDWLERSGDFLGPSAFEDQAEQRVLWDLESLLESKLNEHLATDYAHRLLEARRRVRDSA